MPKNTRTWSVLREVSDGRPHIRSEESPPHIRSEERPPRLPRFFEGVYPV